MPFICFQVRQCIGNAIQEFQNRLFLKSPTHDLQANGSSIEDLRIICSRISFPLKLSYSNTYTAAIRTCLLRLKDYEGALNRDFCPPLSPGSCPPSSRGD